MLFHTNFDGLHRLLSLLSTTLILLDVVKKCAHLRYFTGQYGKAKPVYDWLAAIFPNRRSAFIKLAGIAWRTGDRAQARTLAEKVIAMRPRVFNPYDAGYVAEAHRILRALGTEP